MSKRASVSSNTIEVKERADRDFYATPEKAALPLLNHLPSTGGKFMEPCAGAGDLVKHIERLSDGYVCGYACDVEPQETRVVERDALTLDYNDVLGIDLIITNPPFKWDMLKPLLDHLPTLRPTWLLLPFDYACNVRMAHYMSMCKSVVPIGRVKWFEDSKQSSTDNFAWFLFDTDYAGATKLYPRQK